MADDSWPFPDELDETYRELLAADGVLASSAPADGPLSPAIESFASAFAPAYDEVLAAMEQRADESGFPTVGPAAGGWLAMLARLCDAERVFEFGSGFGYSAYWVARVLPPDGEVVLTEHDADELAAARAAFERGGYADRATFEHGDANEIVDRHDGPFDLVLVDHRKGDYWRAFQAVRPKVPVGGVVVADNAITAGPIDFDAVRTLVGAAETADAESGGTKLDAGSEGATLDAESRRATGEQPSPPVSADALREAHPDGATLSDETLGVATYLINVRADAAFQTSILPVGEGLAVSVRVA